MASVTAADKALYERIASLAGWAIGDHFGCGYSGDSDPINHDGFYYDPRDWERFGYANVVEFWADPERDDVLHASRGTVHKPDDLTQAWQCVGVSEQTARANVHLQIDAVRSYCGIEPDGTDYPHVMTFKLDEWKEWRIWRSVAPWLEELGA